MMIDDHILLSIARLRKRWLSRTDPMTSQEKILLKLVRKSVHTTFGREHDFSSIRTSRDFLSCVKPRSYDDLSSSIAAIIDGERDVLFPGYPECFALTSGTNGAPKRIPLTRQALRSTQRAAIDAALLGGLKHGSGSWHWGKTLYIGPRKGYAEGSWSLYTEGTAFAFLQPFTGRFVPQYENLPEQGEEPDYSLFADLARHHEITSVAGNPIEIGNFVSITGMVMPEVSIIFNCGYWANDCQYLYETAFPNATIVDIYGSNEGTFGLPWSTGEFLLNCGRIFFSLVPVDNNLECVSIGQSELHRKYQLCVTTSGGLWNYVTGDVVSFTSFRPPLIRLHGRDCRLVSLADDWLTEDEVVSAVRKSQIFNTRYFLAPVNHDGACFEDGRSHLSQFALCVDGNTADAVLIDRYLCEMNSTYAHLRASGRLAPLTVEEIANWKPEQGKPARIRREVRNETHPV